MTPEKLVVAIGSVILIVVVLLEVRDYFRDRRLHRETQTRERRW